MPSAFTAWAIETDAGLSFDHIYRTERAAQESKARLDRRNPICRGVPVSRRVVRVRIMAVREIAEVAA